jgi:hypothetical protein
MGRLDALALTVMNSPSVNSKPVGSVIGKAAFFDLNESEGATIAVGGQRVELAGAAGSAIASAEFGSLHRPFDKIHGFSSFDRPAVSAAGKVHFWGWRLKSHGPVAAANVPIARPF